MNKVAKLESPCDDYNKDYIIREIIVRSSQIMLQTYGEDFFYQMLNNTKPKPKEISNSQIITSLKSNARPRVVNSILKLSKDLIQSDRTFHLSISIMDKYLITNKKINAIKNPQIVSLIGVTSFFLASKFEEVIPCDIDYLIGYTYGYFNREEILKMERMILTSLNFDLIEELAYDHVRLIFFDLKVNNLNDLIRDIMEVEDIESIAMNICKVITYDWFFHYLDPFFIAVCCIYTALEVHKSGSCIKSKDLYPWINSIINKNGLGLLNILQIRLRIMEVMNIHFSSLSGFYY